MSSIVVWLVEILIFPMDDGIYKNSKSLRDKSDQKHEEFIIVVILLCVIKIRYVIEKMVGFLCLLQLFKVFVFFF